MEPLFADTNIFGIAVDPGDDRREAVWETLDTVAAGTTSLASADLVLTEIRENPHGPTRKKELELYRLLVDDTYPLDETAERAAERLEQAADLGIVDAQLVAIAAVNGCTFWSGDQRLLNEENVEVISRVLSEEFQDVSFSYRIE
ncbi:MAG: hypothetical protein SVU88_01860 [Candidatus Nanohaloarchaea archaeon]|nr:hypothetical protein [Candidatus Nanohaloarchaea archaeon]